MSTKLIERIILYPLIIILAFLLFRSCGRANTLQDTLKQREALELSEKFWQDKADSLSKNIKVRIDTLKVTVSKIKYKDKIIYVKQDSVMALSTDSGVTYLMQWSGQPVIKD